MSTSNGGFSRAIFRFLKATIIGGLLFLLPLVLVALVFGKAIQAVAKFAKPITSHLPSTFLGIGMASVVAALILIVISLAAGIFARTRYGKQILQWFENSLFGGLPQYQLVKSLGEGFAHVEDAESVKPVLVSIEDGWQIGYLLEDLDADWVAVFLPQAPTPMSGNVMYIPANRTRPLNISMAQAMALVKRIGVGSGQALQGLNLRRAEMDIGETSKREPDGAWIDPFQVLIPWFCGRAVRRQIFWGSWRARSD